MSDEIKTTELEAANEILEKLKQVHAETNEGLCIECGDHYPCPTRYIIGRPYDEGTAHVRFQPRRDMAEAIQRVRELARKFEAEDGDGNGFLQYGLAASRIFSALDGDPS